MRQPLTPKVLFASLLPLAAAVLCAALPLRAQEPETPAPAPEAPQQPPAAEPTQPSPEGRPRRARRAQRTVAIEAAHVHPVAGPAIEDGVVVVRGDRIVAIGKRGEVEVPDGAEVVRYEGAHLYPGLVDAHSDAFLDDSTRSDGSADPATAVAAAVAERRDREDGLVRAGVTTAYVQNRRGNPWAGTGAVVRPKKDGATVFPGKDKAGLGLTLAAPPVGTHALDRQRTVEGAFAAFAGLDAYRKQFEEHAKALEKYTKDFDAFLAFHRKKNGKEEPKPAGDKPASTEPAKPGEAAGPGAPANGEAPRGPGSRGNRGGRGGRRGGETPPEQPAPDTPKPETPAPQEPKPDQPKPQEPKPPEPKPQEPKPQDPKPAETKPQEPKADAPKPEAPKAQGEAAAKPDEKPPERPKYPKAPERDPVKDALLAVLDGEMPLRVEVRRADEVRACLQAAQERKLPGLVLTDVLAAGSIAPELAAAGASCVLSGVLAGDAPEPFAELDVRDLPRQLHEAGVAFALASGSGRSARALPLMAATAVGNGLDEAAALRAITLSAAEILGVQKDTGSLQNGKLADLLVTDRPLFASDSRVLAVWSAGVPQFEADSKKEPR